MRVSLPHLGHAVDFVVSMTFLRSAVFAIFAIQSLLTGMCRQPESCGSTWYLGSIVVRQRTPAHLLSVRQDQPGQKRCTVLASRILHDFAARGATAALLWKSGQKAPHLWGAVHRKTNLLAGALQARSLRTIDGAIANAQRSRPRPLLCRREHHADRARGVGGQTRRAGRCRLTEVASRRDHDAVKTYALLVGERKYLRRTGRSHRLARVGR